MDSNLLQILLVYSTKETFLQAFLEIQNLEEMFSQYLQRVMIM